MPGSWTLVAGTVEVPARRVLISPLLLIPLFFILVLVSPPGAECPACVSVLAFGPAAAHPLTPSLCQNLFVRFSSPSDLVTLARPSLIGAVVSREN